MKTIYISGRITGIEAQAEILFNQAEIALKNKGYTVVNPMKLPHQHDKTWESYMKECVIALMACDAVFVLDNWQESKGAKVEIALSVHLNLKIYSMENIDSMPFEIKLP